MWDFSCDTLVLNGYWLTARIGLCALHYLQVRSKKQQPQQVERSCSFSRRDTALCVAALTLSSFILLLSQPAEARTTKFENKKRVMERLERLREEAKGSKPGSPEGSVPGTATEEEKVGRQPSPQPLVEAMLPWQAALPYVPFEMFICSGKKMIWKAMEMNDGKYKCKDNSFFLLN